MLRAWWLGSAYRATVTNIQTCAQFTHHVLYQNCIMRYSSHSMCKVHHVVTVIDPEEEV